MKLLSSVLFALVSFDASATLLHGGVVPTSSFVPILDSVKCASSSDAAYGTVRLRSAYNGPAIEMRVKQSGTYVYQSIGFAGNVVDATPADTFVATADSGTPAELRFYDPCGNGNDTTFSATSTYKGAIWPS